MAGHVDALTSGLLVENLERLAAGPTRIGLDLAGVDFIDTASAALLASIRERLAQEGCLLEVWEVSPQVRDVFLALGMTTLLSRGDRDVP